MIRLSVAEIASPYCGTYKQAEQLFNKISNYLRAGEQIQLDFEHVELASSSFFNELFGRLSEKFGDAILDSHLSFDGLKPRHRFVLDRTRHIAPA